MNGQETEIKFYVGNLPAIETRLVELGAHLFHARVHETNLRFDTPDRALRQKGKVLRLRMDESARMTFKDQGHTTDGVISRKEIEFEIGDFAAGRELIESLGYEVMLFYEKYRTTYELNNLHIMLDELPYGDFVEIEGDEIAEIVQLANQLNLDTKKAIEASYQLLFERVAEKNQLNVNSLSFETFKNKKPTAGEMGVTSAD